MALTVTVDVSREATEVGSQIAARAAALQGARLNTQIGRGVAELFRLNFRNLDRERANALGGKRTHFYSDAMKATFSSGDDEGATVTVAALGIRQRLLGGTIKPREGKYLTIPARAEAYGRRAREFQNLKFVRLSGGRGMLVADGAGRAGHSSKKHIGSKEEGLVYFWLVPSVHQDADPTVLPNEGAIRAVVAGVVTMAWNRRQAAGGNSGGPR